MSDGDFYKTLFGEDKFRQAKIYIDILAYAIHKNNSPQWIDRIFKKVCRICRWTKEDIVDYSKSLIAGQEAIILERYLDYRLAEVEKDKYWGGSRTKFEQFLADLNNCKDE